MKMKKTYTTNLPVALIQRVNNTVLPGMRSRFIEAAIREKLGGHDAVESSIADIPSRRLLAILHERDDVSPSLKALILLELSS